MRNEEVNKLSCKLKQPGDCFYSPRDLFDRKKIPEQKGVYAWYFKGLSGVPSGSQDYNGFKLLYVGITKSLRKRISSHCTNSAKSTLRRTLGALHNLALCSNDNGKYRLSKVDEGKLNVWLNENACVTWIEHNEPEKIEKDIISELKPKLNLVFNQECDFYKELKKILCEARRDKC